MWDEYEDFEDDEDDPMGKVEKDIVRQSVRLSNEAEANLRRRPHLEDADWWVS